MKRNYLLTETNRLDIMELIRQTPNNWILEIRSPDRTAAQNRFYWATLRQISEWVKPERKKYDPNVWHSYMKELFLRNELIELPNGELIEAEKTTTNLSKHDFSDYVTNVLAWANENGVIWSDEMHNAYHDAEMKK
jgi:hypothetical protein